MTQRYDAIICGGGPAGSAAALALARRGHAVAVLDRARFPRPKLCGGLLTWKTVRLLETALGETVDCLARAGAVIHRSDRYVIRTFDKPLAEGALPFPFHFVDRAAFDNHLLRKAEAEGASVIQGVEAASVDTEKGVVMAVDGRTWAGDWIIGADGANSVVRKAFAGVDRERMRRLMAPALEIALPAAEFRPVACPELYVGFLDAGYGWVFPHGEAVVAGICGLRREKINFSAMFKEYLEFLGVDPAAVRPFRGHPLPYGNYLEEPVEGRALLAGDAAGLVEPLFGEGIFFSLCSGWYAGEAVAHGLARRGDPGPVYLRRLHRQILPELRASDRLRWLIFRAMRHTGPGSLGFFVNAAARPLAEMVHGMRSYAWLRRKRWDFLEG
ncbi:geranylgeranyl reductase family protein [Pseudodesulfovibrio sp.]|uniref:geranylgeranyl reductase family protein n=1 Tax=Pseudodesulfovibrio sp. TaxID=2035812 RepID=UPI00262BF63C|nr:geranylgeranyl reductase family protein [Pseudodesulfovibrio sp.]MDD3312238.1 geranylgeranyl reductase family protein [Pseudodesulfovibrio sp.]